MLQFTCSLATFFRPSAAIHIDIENVIEPQAAEQLLVSCIHVQHGDGATATIPQVTSHSGKSAQESGVHHRAAIQIENEVTDPRIDAVLNCGFDTDAVLKTSFAVNAEPEDISDLTNEYGRRGIHVGIGGGTMEVTIPCPIDYEGEVLGGHQERWSRRKSS